MKVCPNLECPDVAAGGVRGEFVDDMVSCPFCDTPLVVPPDVDDHAGEDLVLAGRVVDASAIEIAKSMLASSEICYTTRFEGLQDLFGGGRLGAGFSILLGPVEFWVPRSQAVEAAELLADLQASLRSTDHDEDPDREDDLDDRGPA